MLIAATPPARTRVRTTQLTPRIPQFCAGIVIDTTRLVRESDQARRLFTTKRRVHTEPFSNSELEKASELEKI